MVPPNPNLKRMTAQRVKPQRYRPGKAEYKVASDSETDSSEEERKKQEAKKAALKPSAKSFRPKAYQVIQVQSRSEEREAAERAARAAKLAQLQEEYETASEEEAAEEEEEESGEEEESSEAESDSSEDRRQAARRVFKPTFVKKNQRDQGAQPEKTADEVWEEEEATRKQLAQQALEEQVEKVKEEKRLGKKEWDDDVADENDIDDTEDIDPEAEYMEWKLRELKRLKRDREKMLARERELEEIERRRNLTEEERAAEDKAFLEQQQVEKGERGDVKFMQRYFHKGAFFSEELEKAGLANRDIMGGRFEDEVDRSVLPKYMQVRDMNKLGKKGRTRYVDMKAEDTGRWGDLGDRKGKPKEDRGIDERFREDFDEDTGPSGANKVALGERKRPGGELKKEGKKPKFDLSSYGY